MTVSPPESASAVAPGPRGAPLLGSALDLRRDMLGTYLRAMREHGDVVRFAAGPPGARLVFHAVFAPDGVQQVLARASARYRKDNAFYEEVRWAFGDGLLNSQDERWLRQKRFVQPLFTHQRIAGYAAAMAEEAVRLLRRWRGAPGGVIELHGEMTRLTLQVVGRILFGGDVGRAVGAVQRAFPVLGEYTLRRGFAPLRVPRSWPTPSNRRAARAQRTMYDLCDELIARRRRAAAGGQDLLGLLLDARDGGQGLDDAEVRDQVLVFLLAGHETTATALTFALHLLGRHPHVQRRAREEVDRTLDGRLPTAGDALALRYTTMVVKEAMRLYPSAPVIGRRTTEDDRIGGYEIPPGSDVYVSPWVTHRHPAFWDDPERFDPERFTPEREAGRHRYAWFPFGGGPRGCIGQHFSMLEAVIAVAAVLQAYELTAPPDRVRLAVKVALRPAGPMPCRLTPRRT